MQYKAIVCDLDGTLLNNEHSFSEFTKSEIRRVTSLGIKVILASGRHYVDIKSVAEQLDLDSCIIASNGTRAYSGDGEMLVKHNLNTEVTEFVMNYNFPSDVHLNIYQGKEWLVIRENKELLEFHKDSGFVYRVIDGIQDLSVPDVNKFYLYSHNPDSLKAVEKDLKDKLEIHADVFFSYHSVIEIMPKGISKGLALEELMNNVGIKSEEVMVFGDALNDYEMLKWAGKGLIMKNADKNLVSKLPDLEIIGDNNEDGVAKYLSENL